MIRFRFFEETRDGTWSSDVHEASDRALVCRDVRAGYTLGYARWAVDMDGKFLYGISRHGKEMHTADDVTRRA